MYHLPYKILAVGTKCWLLEEPRHELVVLHQKANISVKHISRAMDKMSTESSDSSLGNTLSIVAQFDELNRINNVLNDVAAEESFLAFLKQVEWVRSQWAAAEAESIRLQAELDEALHALGKWEAKFANVRKLLDGSLLSEMSYSRSENDWSLSSSRCSWVQKGGWAAHSESATDTPRAPQRTPSVVSAGYGSPRHRVKQHNFVAKTFYKRETCGPCGKIIKFAKTGVKCEECRAQTHLECRLLLPLPCVPPGRHTAAQEGTISDYAPSTPPMVPALLVHCINEIEKRGLSERGIYRISAVDRDVKRLKERFLRGCGSPQLSGVDVHIICGCVKDFLRSLREPLVTNALWSDFMQAARVTEPADATAAVIQALGTRFRDFFIKKVAESPECEMGIDNLSKVFAPTVVGYGMMTESAEMYTATAHMFNSIKKEEKLFPMREALIIINIFYTLIL
ncbi:unnamed protein product [Leptidea sinapis]|uniref:Phorbol-ester/DAG-type domain-containing protein n=1 Tax=Leptidea sinapis TaxID=189913 RepID=A0A5E4QYG0_9NEOP|nr:unnamed protein product [Leptidea sinapis]